MEVEVLCNIAESVPDDSCVYVAVETNEVTSGRKDWGIPGHPVYDVEAMYLPPLDSNDLTPRAVALALRRIG